MTKAIKKYLLFKFIYLVDKILVPHGWCTTKVFGFRDGNDA